MQLAITLTALAWADCAGGGLGIVPEAGARVPSEPQLVVQASGFDRDRFADLDPADLALVPQGGEPVGVRIVAVHQGDFTDTQIIVAPAAPLPAGRVELTVRGERPEVWTGSERVPMHWTVTEVPDAAPTWAEPPAVASTDRTPFGCGPAVSITVTTAVDAPWVEASVARAGHDPVTARLPVEDGTISLGHTMCSGMLELQEGERYEARLTAVSATGQRSAAPEPVAFTAP